MLLVLPIGAGLSWWLSHGKDFPGKWLIQTLVTLPLVLPPTAVGFYLLLVLGHGTAVGRWLNDVPHLRLLFTWEGAGVAAAAMSLPLFVRTATATFSAVDETLLEVGRTLGAGDVSLLAWVIIPLSYRGLLAALSLAFARALGEFGATLMVAGSIPGQTQTLPLALYAAVQAGHDHDALIYTLILSAAALVLTGCVSAYERHLAGSRGER